MIENYHGWLNVYKVKGETSFSISKSLKKKFNFKKLGHLGTLDPLAEGVLPIAIGEATKVINYIANNKKRYSFTIKWGEETTTFDREGEVTDKSGVRPNYEKINNVIQKFFLGSIEQTPPSFSAVKVNGERAYKLARKKIRIQLKKKKIYIFKIEAKPSTDVNFCDFDVICSRGTYIRSLARDIARKLGTFGYAYEIIRKQDNIFKSKDSDTLKNILDLNICDMCNKIIPIEAVLNEMEEIILEKKYSEMLKNGMILKINKLKNKVSNENKLVLVKNDSKLICIANIENQNIVPKRNFNL